MKSKTTAYTSWQRQRERTAVANRPWLAKAQKTERERKILHKEVPPCKGHNRDKEQVPANLSRECEQKSKRSKEQKIKRAKD